MISIAPTDAVPYCLRYGGFMAATKYRITLGQLVDDYLALQCTRPVTQTSPRYHLAGLLALYGGWQARRLKPQQIMDYLDSQRHDGVALVTATHRVKLLRTVLRWGVSSGRQAVNPLDGLRPGGRAHPLQPAPRHAHRGPGTRGGRQGCGRGHGPRGPDDAAARLPAHPFPPA